MTQVCLTFKEKMDAVNNAINNNQNILVYGEGNNGKTSILRSPNVKEHHAWINTKFDDKESISSYLSFGIPMIFETNGTPSNDMKDFCFENNIVILEFVGKWDSNLKDYILQ